MEARMDCPSDFRNQRRIWLFCLKTLLMKKENVNHLCLLWRRKALSCFYPYIFKDQLEKGSVDLDWTIWPQNSIYDLYAANGGWLELTTCFGLHQLLQGDSATGTRWCGNMGRPVCICPGHCCCCTGCRCSFMQTSGTQRESCCLAGVVWCQAKSQTFNNSVSSGLWWGLWIHGLVLKWLLGWLSSFPNQPWSYWAVLAPAAQLDQLHCLDPCDVWADGSGVVWRALSGPATGWWGQELL